MDVLREKEYFSVLDLKEGFLHIDVAEDSIKYTAFITPLGQYEYLKMPFGLKTGPEKCQRFCDTVFADLIKSGDVVVYMDDILVVTQTLEFHFQVLSRVFRLIVDNKLQLRDPISVGFYLPQRNT